MIVEERTDGDGMESETPLDVNKSAGAMQGPSSVGDALQCNLFLVN